MANKNKIQLGHEGEKMAASYLEKKGYTILKMNYRCRIGEIDIIARKQGVYVFIEVKTRKSLHFGLPVEAIDYNKKHHLFKTAQHYIQYHKLYSSDFRFDAIEVYIQMTGKVRINHIMNIIC